MKFVAGISLCLMLVSCAAVVRDHYDVGESRSWLIRSYGNPTKEYGEFIPIPPRSPNRFNAVKTLYYDRGYGHSYFYLNEKDIVVDSLYFGNWMQF